MNRNPLKSTWLKSAGYDPQKKTLEVEYKSAAVFHYHDVPKETADQLMKAKSVGAFFHSDINGKFKSKQL